MFEANGGEKEEQKALDKPSVIQTSASFRAAEIVARARPIDKEGKAKMAHEEIQNIYTYLMYSAVAVRKIAKKFDKTAAKYEKVESFLQVEMKKAIISSQTIHRVLAVHKKLRPSTDQLFKDKLIRDILDTKDMKHAKVPFYVKNSSLILILLSFAAIMMLPIYVAPIL